MHDTKGLVDHVHPADQVREVKPVKGDAKDGQGTFKQDVTVQVTGVVMDLTGGLGGTE
jgi:hypothetical protein